MREGKTKERKVYSIQRKKSKRIEKAKGKRKGVNIKKDGIRFVICDGIKLSSMVLLVA